LRRVLAFYPIVLIAGFMKPYSDQPRLGLMTRTLSEASVDIFHFGVVFMLVFCIYSIVAMMLFGEELEDFANFGRAFVSTFHCLLGNFIGQNTLEDGEFEIARVGRAESALWLWSLCWLVNLIMLNMLLAIVMDTYANVLGGLSSDAESLWSQSSEIAKRTWSEITKQALPLEKVLLVLDPTSLNDDDDDPEDEDPWTKETLMKFVKGLPGKQADILIEGAVKMETDNMRASQEARTARKRFEAYVRMEEDVRWIGTLAESHKMMLQAIPLRACCDLRDSVRSAGGRSASTSALASTENPAFTSAMVETSGATTSAAPAAECGPVITI
jgi:hypothetical protein